MRDEFFLVGCKQFDEAEKSFWKMRGFCNAEERNLRNKNERTAG
jgi:hypothetical protein